MKKIASLILLFGVLAVFIGCAEDVFVEPPPSLTGDYTGVYIFKEGSQVAVQQYITWRFSQNGYQNRFDEAVEQDTLFCETDGQYELVNGVNLIETSPNSTQITCNAAQNPTGFFQLDQSTDTVKMTQYDSETEVLKTIKLVKDE